MRAGNLAALLTAVLLAAGCASVPQKQGSATPSQEFAVLQALVEGVSSPALGATYQQLQTAYTAQPDFSCRQPVYAAYFRRQAPAGEAQAACAVSLPLLLRDAEQGWRLRQLDMRRVRAVHLLFAGKSSALASRYGHVALRVVVCPDQAAARAASSEACDINLDEHLVLGFQAYVDDSQISLRRAIFGGYRARLVAQPFMEAYTQYTTAEFRDLHSLPLSLNPKEQEDLLSGLVQLHWSHESDYRFFDRNCATLLQAALAGLWPRYREAMADESFMRPDAFFEAIQRSGLGDVDRLRDADRARREGYVFSSNEVAYREAAELLRAAMRQPFFFGLDDYLARPAVQRRAALVTDVALPAALEKNARLREAPLLLEELAMLRAERRVLQAAASRWELKQGEFRYKGERSLTAAESSLLHACLLSPLRALFMPPARQRGIPSEAGASLRPLMPCAAEQKTEFQAMVRRDMEKASSDWRPLLMAVNELAETVINVAELRRSLEERHVYAGSESHVM